MVKNIFISGADGTRKTTISKKLADYIATEFQREVKWISFPSDHTFSTMAIYGHRQERAKIPPRALTAYYAIDRLEEAEILLEPYRRSHPDVVYIFDRGPLDGKAYALDRFRDEMTPIMENWINNLDSLFEQMFPVDLGFLMAASFELSQQMIYERRNKPVDVFDKDLGWQKRTAVIFDKLVKDDPRWNRIELMDNGREFETIKEIVATRLDLTREGRIVRDRQV